ncbi:MAG: AraC family transcriptional regulator [Clostridia bacterium]|nr:AraC family transcriptional regulator [Clostridia bacterium]
MLKVTQEDRPYVSFMNDAPEKKHLNMLEFGYSIPNAGTMVGPRVRSSYLMHFVLGGSGKFDRKELSAGEGFLICPNRLHSFKTDSLNSWEHCWIGFNGNDARDILKEFNISTENHIFSFTAPDKLKERVKQLCQKNSPSELELFSLFYYMLSLRGDIKNISEKQSLKPDDYIEKVASAIRSSYMYDLKISELAADINISPKYLWRIFTKKMGISPKKYLLDTRMNVAKKYLLSTNLTVAEIARSVGYGDAVSFMQNFKNYEHMTPTEYRSTHKSNNES